MHSVDMKNYIWYLMDLFILGKDMKIGSANKASGIVMSNPLFCERL